MALRGIDVSTYQGNINWSAVKASGIDFAIVKATQGRAVNSNSYLFTDRQFAANVTGAHDVGLKVGVYHYLTAKTVKKAQTEAAHFCETIAPYKPRIELWAAVDVEEDKYLPRNKKLLSDIVNGTTQVTEGISAGMGIDIKSLIMGALGGRMAADNNAPVVVVQPAKDVPAEQDEEPENE